MARAERLALIKKLQEQRKSWVITYITSTRPGFEVPMGDDAVRQIYEHLVKKPGDCKQVDLFIYSNGGSGTVPWRLVSLIREFADRFDVLIPHRAYSAATLTALGADNIVMHQMGELGPIDPSVANAFNPRDSLNNNQPIPISVEDVLSYIALVKEDVGIRHEDELVQALVAFMNAQGAPVHPLALGNVKRHHARGKMVARKLLLTHMDAEDDGKIERIVDNLTSKLFFHGHPISRQEASEDLDLAVDMTASTEVLETMWSLYLEYENELKLREPLNLSAEVEKAQPHPSGQQQPAQPMQGQQVVMTPNGPMVVSQGAPGGQPAYPPLELTGIKGAFIESAALCHQLEFDMRVRKMVAGPQVLINAETLRTEWKRYD
jgi:hypothetical protein